MAKVKNVSFLKVCAVSLFALSVSPVHAFAAGTGDNPAFTPDIKSPKQIQAEAIKEKELATYKLNRASFLAAGSQKEIAVPSFKQETSYWCGPATTKQVLHFFNGSSLSQQDYAKQLGTTKDGTDFSKVDDVLNANQSKTTYIYKSFNDNEFSDWKNTLEIDINASYPTVLDLKITPQNMPKYTAEVEGHILNASGYDYVYGSAPEIRLTDPFDQGNRGVTLGNVWHPMDGVWNANQAHFRKAILW
ncbi:Peptidase_C39 like family protein [Paenibacillus tianmuensis]|uniref:Peptidase_C39 like family protein n=1 Tax=Paenibacillus tianmuensis TaxID=624147 RepID=A0A1G4T9B7_9BACL|nr:C39 family peptidase [Paenibacillus tianmuensis]SCW77139.1 Peptidase_C39 like family protein [Paenibacillus tianmuensis]